MQTISEKLCPKPKGCGETKPFLDFYPRSDGKPQTHCKVCFSRIKKERYALTREHDLAKAREWQTSHPDNVKATQRRYRAKPERKERMRELEQQPHIKAKRQAYDETHRKENAAYNSNWKKNNKDKVNAYAHNRRAKTAGNGGEHTGQEWRALMARYGWHCIRCGALVPLCFEHIVAISVGGNNNISNGQPYCVSCNTSKGKKFVDLRDHPDHGRRYDTRPDLPIGAVDIAMGDLPTPTHAQHPRRVDIIGRTEKMCSYHKRVEPISNFRTKSKKTGLPYPECREAEAIHNRERRARNNPSYKPRDAIARNVQPVIKKEAVPLGMKLCRGPKHDSTGVMLPVEVFSTRRATSGNIVPKPYCRDCKNEMQNQARAAKKAATPQIPRKQNPVKGIRLTLPEDQRGTKTCKGMCGLVKPVSEFNYTIRAKGKLQPMCRDCQKAEQLSTYVKHPRPVKQVVPKVPRAQPTERPCADCGTVFAVKFREDGTPIHTSYCHACKMRRQHESRTTNIPSPV